MVSWPTALEILRCPQHKMKILVNTRFLLRDHLEGIGRYSYEILRRWVSDHSTDQFVFCFDRPYDPNFVFGHNVKPLILRPPARHAILFYWWYHYALPKVYQREKADVLFSPDGFIPLSEKVERTLITIHDLAYRHYPDQISKASHWYYQKFMPRYIEKANQIVTVSKSTKQDIELNFPQAAGKVTVVYNGVSEHFRPLTPNERQSVQKQFTGGVPYFIALGAIHPRKNVARLIRAFSDFKARYKTEDQLLIVGRMAWQTDDIKTAAEQSPYQDAIQFLHYVSDEDLPKLVASSTALVYVSLFEGFGLPVLEGMRSGVPVITSNRSSMAEIAGSAAFLVHPELSDEICEAMHKVKSLSPSERNVWIQKGRKRAESFHWEKAAMETFRVLMQASR